MCVFWHPVNGCMSAPFISLVSLMMASMMMQSIFGDDSSSMLYGTFLHQLFQEAMVQESVTDALLECKARSIIANNLDGLYVTGPSSSS